MSDSDAHVLRESAVRWVAPDVGGDSLSSQSGDGPMTVDKLEALQHAAYEEAFAQGLEAGRTEGLTQLAGQTEVLIQCIENLSEPFRELDEEVEQSLVSLAIRIARQIIRRELRMDPGQIVGVVREAVELLPVASRNVEVHLHPEDAAVVRAAFGDSSADFAWSLVEDPVLTRGGLRVTTDTSQIDARVEKRLDSILATLVGDEREQDA